MVDALRRRSGRIPLLWVLSSGNGLRGGARMAAEPQNTPSKALSSLGTDQEREPGTGPLARPVRVCQKAGAYTPLEPSVFRGSRRSRPSAPEPSGCGAGCIGDGSPASAGDSWTRCDRVYGTDPYATVLPSTVRRRGVRPATTARRAATAGLLLIPAFCNVILLMPWATALANCARAGPAGCRADQLVSQSAYGALNRSSTRARPLVTSFLTHACATQG